MTSISRTLLGIILLYICSIAEGKILTIHKLSEIWPELTKSDSHTLILFDAQDVLIAPLPGYNMEHPYRKNLISQYKKHYLRIKLIKC